MNPGWEKWCQKEFIHKMHHDGKLDKPNYSGLEAKGRRVCLHTCFAPNFSTRGYASSQYATPVPINEGNTNSPFPRTCSIML